MRDKAVKTNLCRNMYSFHSLDTAAFEAQPFYELDAFYLLTKSRKFT